MRHRFPYSSDVELMKNNIINAKTAESKLLPPDNPEEINRLIEKIEDEKLKKALKNLIASAH